MTARPLAAGLLVVILFPFALHAATPAEELLRYVPPDSTLCLVLRDLREHGKTLAGSPFAEHLRKSSIGIALAASPELKKAEEFLETTLGMRLDKIRDDVLGDAIVFAYRQGPPGKKEQEQGLVLVRARDAKALAEFVQKIDAFLKLSGDLKEVKELEHEGVKYFRRTEGSETSFLCLRGPVLIFTGQETLLHEALALQGKTKESAIGKSLAELGADKALAALWVNPRSLDAELAARIKTAVGEQKAFLETFGTCWKALDAAAITLNLTSDLELGLTLRGRPQALPAAIRRFLDDASTMSDLWARFPNDALIAIGARSSASELFAFLGAFRSPQAEEDMYESLNRTLGAALGGMDVKKDVLPYVGPDWGLCVTAPPRGDKAWFPNVVFALRVAPGDAAMPVDKAMVKLLDLQATLALLGFNQTRKEKLNLKTATIDKLEVRYLASPTGQAIGLQPAFGLSDGHLVIASTPETLRRFAVAPKGAKLPPGEVPLLRVSFADLRQYLKDRQKELSNALAEQQKLAPKEMEAQIENVLAALSLVDRLELTQQVAANQVSFKLRLKPVKPLRK